KSRASMGTAASPGIDETRLPGEQPAETVQKPVAPVDPVMTVQGFDDAQLVAHALEHLDHRAIRHGQGLESTECQEDAVGDLAGLRPYRVDEAHHRFEHLPERAGSARLGEAQ